MAIQFIHLNWILILPQQRTFITAVILYYEYYHHTAQVHANCPLFVAFYFDADTAKGVASNEATEAIKTETVVSVDTIY